MSPRARTSGFALWLATHFLFGCASALAGQISSPQEAASAPLRVFLECGPCDSEFVRESITYVAWMRDRQSAELHVIQRSQATGGAGRQHTLDFIGLQRHEGKADTLSYVQGPDDTQDTTRRGLSRVLAIGLMRYVADTPEAERIAINLQAAAPGTPSGAASGQVPDRWNAWVFSIGGNGNTTGESTQARTNFSANLSANRVTADWKVNLSMRGSYGRQEFTYALPADRGDTTVVSITRSYNASGLLVRSLTGHASVGVRTNASKSTFGNTNRSLTVQPAVEYNLYPYAESTRRQFVMSYGAGVLYQTYREETIYSRLKETRPVHTLSGSYTTRQTWGNLNFGISGQQFLHDSSLYNLNFFGGASVNVARGLSVNFNANYTMVRDQINLAKRNLSAEEVLLRQRQVATSYRYFTSFGLSYRFGSSVQSVVNPRFTGGGGGEVIFF